MPDPITRAEAEETVEYCPHCRTKTWHRDRVCEWSDGHIAAALKPFIPQEATDGQ